MKKLQEEFVKNEIRYKLIKRTDKVAMYGHLGEYTDDVISIEVFRIPVKEPDKFRKNVSEVIPSDSHFGISYDSKAFGGKDKWNDADAYYKSLVTGDESLITRIGGVVEANGAKHMLVTIENEYNYHQPVLS